MVAWCELAKAKRKEREGKAVIIYMDELMT
jgi:hypothetical protein